MSIQKVRLNVAAGIFIFVTILLASTVDFIILNIAPPEASAAVPVAHADADQTLYKNMLLDRSNVTLNGSNSIDPDDHPLAYNWYGPFPTTNGKIASVTIPEGTYTVSLLVDDGINRSETDTSTVNISPCFTIAPRAKARKVQVTWTPVDGTERYQIFRAQEETPLNFTKIAETTSTYATYLDETVVNENTYLYVVGALIQGNWCFSNIVSSRPSALRTIANYAPVIYSKPITTATTGIIYNYDVNAADPNSNTLSYSLISFPDGMAISPITGLITWTPETTGSYDVSVNVSDGKGGTAVQDYSITVSEIPALNQPPHITSSPILNATEGIIYAYPVTAEDPDQDTLVFSLLEGPAGSTIDPVTGLLKWPSPLAGSFPVTLKVSDERGGTDTQTFTLTVKDTPNRPPVFTSVPVVDAYVNKPYTYDADATDPDQDMLTFSLNSGPGGLIIDSSSGIAGWTPTAGQAGEHRIILEVNDGKNGVAMQSYTVFVHNEPGNTAPVIISEPVTKFTPCITYSYNVDALDADGDELIYSLLDSPPGMSIDPISGIISATTVELPIPELNFTAHNESVFGNAAKTDSDGNTYITGTFSSTTDFDPGPETYNLSSKGGQDIFVMKLDKNGRLLWVFSFGSTGAEEVGRSIAIDPWGDVCVTGYFENTVDFDPSENIYNLTSKGGQDLFVLKLSAQGEFRWARSAGSADNDVSLALATDSEGNIITTGWFHDSVDFDPGSGEHKLTSNGSIDTFVWKLDKDGNFVWACSAGGPDGDHGYDITTDRLGNIYVIGNFVDAAVDFDPSPGVFLLTAESHDAFVWKLDKDGNMVWAGQIGGPGIDQGQGGIAVDKDFNVYVTGEITGPADLDPGPDIYNVTGFGGYDIFVCKLDINGNLIWGHVVGSQYNDVGYGIAVACSGSVYVTGTFDGAVDFDPGPGQDVLSSFAFNAYDGFLWKLDKDGNHLWARRFGNTGQDGVYDVHINDVGLLTVSGIISGPTDLDLTDGVFNTGPTNNAQWGFAAVYNTIEFDPDVTVQVSDGRGGVDTQKFTLVFEKAPNSPPKITSTPAFTATEGITYQYDADATDPDGDSLTFSLIIFPSGMAIDLSSGLITWTPSFTSAGSHDVTIRVSDGRGEEAIQSFSILVTEGTPSIQITSSPVTTAETGCEYQYDVDAVDPNGNSLIFGLLTFPQGMMIYPDSGIIRWIPSQDQTGSHDMVVKVSDGKGNTATQNFTIVVVINNPPVITSEALTNGTNGVLYEYNVEADDADGDTLQYTLKVVRDCLSPPSDQVGWLPGDGTVEDLKTGKIGSGYNGAPTYTSGLVSQAFHFDGYDDLILVPHDPAYDFIENQDFTIDVWVKLINPTPGKGDYIVNTYENRSAISGRTANFFNLNLENDTQKVSFGLSTNTIQYWLISEGSVPMRDWTHIAISRRGSNGFIYINGELDTRSGPDPNVEIWPLNQGFAGYSSEMTRGSLASPDPLVIGACYDKIFSNLVQSGWGFGGLIDELELHGRALTDDEIRAVYQAGRLGKCKSEESLPEGMTFDSSTGLIAWMPGYDQIGRYFVTVEVSDGRCKKDIQVFELNINERPNNPPIFISAPVTIATAGELYTYNVEASDPEGDPVTYRLRKGLFASPSDVVVDAKGDLIVTDPNAFDGAGALFRVDPVTGAQTIIASGGNFVYPAGVAIDSNGNLIVIDKEAFDGSGGVIRVNPMTGQQTPVSSGGFFVTPTGIAIAPNGDIMVTDGGAFHGTGGLIRIDPSTGTQSEFSSGGDFRFPVDIAIGSDGEIFVLDRTAFYNTSTGQGGAVFRIDPLTGAQTVISSGETFLYVAGIAVAPDGSILVTDSHHTHKAIVRVDPETGTQTTVSAGGHIEYPQGITLDDVGGILLADFNARGGSIVRIYNGSQQVVSPLIIQGMTIDPSAGLIIWTPTPDQVGSQSVTVEISDDRGSKSVQTFIVEVSGTGPLNHDPVITSSPLASATVGVLYSYDAEANDQDNDPLTYTLIAEPSGMTIDSSTGLITWTPSSGDIGGHNVKVSVVDGRGGQATQTFSLQVTEIVVINHPPEITSTPAFTVRENVQYHYHVNADDPDGDTLTYILMSAPSGMTIDSLTGLIAWTPSNADVGGHQVQVRVFDGKGAYATQSFSLQVLADTPANNPPAITSTPSFVVNAGKLFEYDMNAFDPDGDTLVYSLPLAPSGMAIDPGTGLVSWTPSKTEVGIHKVEIKVDDGRGGTATQKFDLEVVQVNHSPLFTSTPGVSATEGILYLYDVDAVDADDDSLVFSIMTGPSGMTIDSATGVIQWTPSAANAGTHPVLVKVSDGKGGEAFQNYSILVAEAINSLPVVVSTPVTSTIANEPYTYVVQATDADNDILRYEILDAPSGMVINETTGLITWTPASEQAGDHIIQIQVKDGREGTAAQNYTLTVGADTTPPIVTLLISPQEITLGDPCTMRVTAVDNVGVVSRSLTINGNPVALDANGNVLHYIEAGGLYVMVATASDAAGNVGTAEGLLIVYDTTPDPDAPMVEISSPENGDVVTCIIDVLGTVSDNNLLYYTLEVARTDDGIFTEIARNTATLSDGVLGSFDPTVFANDSYYLRLTAVDAATNTSSVTTEVSVAGNLKIGNFTLSFTDLSIPVSGIPVTVSRTYDTLNSKQKSDLGYGWRLEIKDTDLRTSVPKTGQEEQGQFNAFTHGTKVYVTTPDGHRQGFTFTPEPPRNVGESFLGIYHPAFTADSGVTSRLTVEDIYIQYVPSMDKFVFYMGSNYNPSDTSYTNGLYVLTTSDGMAYAIDALSGDLRTLSDTNNNSLTFTDSAVISSAGPRINFTRDSSGRITSLVAPDGNRVIYGYDAKGDLVSVTDREGNVTKFVYSSNPAHYLNEIIDPLGRTGIRNEYDNQGRLVKMFDVNGKEVELIHNPENSIETVVDVLGNQTLYIYDSRGNVITESDSLGGVKERTYDNNNFLLTETDALGNTTTYTRDGKGNPLTITDPLGNTTYNTYGPFGLLLTTTDPLGNTTTNAYDSRGNLISTTDAAGNKTIFTCDGSGNQTSVKDAMGKTTTYGYDSAGNQISQTDPMGHITRYSYDGNGNQVSRTDPLGNITTNIYNANGQLISTTDALGNTSLTEYNALGKHSATIDPLGNRTGFIYDAKGQLIRTIYPDGAVEESNYDEAGRRISSTDSLGNITTYEYDALGRVVETVLPDGASTRTEYDGAGRSIAQIDALGNRTEFEYDAAGRKILTRDALGNETTTGYDAAGRRVSQTNTLGNTTDFDYDVLGRQTQVTYADGSTTQKTYDALGRPVTQTDQAGNLTHFEYDALGKLTAVIDALGQRTEYGYDIKGNMITQKDANGHITRFEYDAEGRRTATILPLGQRSDAAYDAAGNLISAVDFKGDTITFEYNSRKQLISKRFPDGTATTFTYTASGQQETITDERGRTSFFYDSRNRLVYRVDPDGTEIHYAYDPVGNRTSVTGKSSTVEYTFDALNRLKTVADLDGGITAYTYDGIGNLIQTDLPNGTAEIRSHDALNRLVRLENRSSAGLISSYQYTLDATGNRTAVAEATGRRVEYTYDNLRRLERETIIDPVNGNRTITYSFDPVGNRLTRNDSAEGITTYVYDANDRLLTETLNSRTTVYAYDDNGNTLSRNAGPQDTADYSWNFENRLVAADVMDTSGTKQLAYQYDAEGIRVSSKVNGAETRYLIDTTHPYQQVFEEYTPENSVLASYVHGNDLISQKRGSERSFYHVDGLGSARELSDTNGQVTDQYLYDAYGRVVSKSGNTANAYLFVGEQRDSNLGLDYLRARYFNTDNARFNSNDNFSGIKSDPFSIHKYIYARNNPNTYYDPSGNFFSLIEVTITPNISSIILVYYKSIISTMFNTLNVANIYLPPAKTAYEISYEFLSRGIISYQDVRVDDIHINARKAYGKAFKMVSKQIASGYVKMGAELMLPNVMIKVKNGLDITSLKLGTILGNIIVGNGLLTPANLPPLHFLRAFENFTKNFAVLLEEIDEQKYKTDDVMIKFFGEQLKDSSLAIIKEMSRL